MLLFVRGCSWLIKLLGIGEMLAKIKMFGGSYGIALIDKRQV